MGFGWPTGPSRSAPMAASRVGHVPHETVWLPPLAEEVLSKACIRQSPVCAAVNSCCSFLAAPKQDRMAHRGRDCTCRNGICKGEHPVEQVASDGLAILSGRPQPDVVGPVRPPSDPEPDLAQISSNQRPSSRRLPAACPPASRVVAVRGLPPWLSWPGCDRQFTWVVSPSH